MYSHLVVGLRRAGALDPEHVAQLAEEGLAVGTLRRTRLSPARDESRKGSWAMRHTAEIVKKIGGKC